FVIGMVLKPQKIKKKQLGESKKLKANHKNQKIPFSKLQISEKIKEVIYSAAWLADGAAKPVALKLFIGLYKNHEEFLKK
ncbi:42035_t:CDS:2, partial [Gigaspora margarita]